MSLPSVASKRCNAATGATPNDCHTALATDMVLASVSFDRQTMLAAVRADIEICKRHVEHARHNLDEAQADLDGI